MFARTRAFPIAALLALSVHGVMAQSVDPNANETKAHRDARMHWWREARFGMFIHWGLYSVPAGSYEGKTYPGLGEWLMHDAKIPVGTYADYAKRFNPLKFDADTWVSIAKAAGMKYIVMTAKHHEGFAMYHSQVDPYNIGTATPYKDTDPIKAMGEACRKQGLKFGVYYSQAQDWHQPGGGAYGGHWDPKQDGDLHAYVQKVAGPQVKELLSKYKPAVLWWDTPVGMSPEDIRALTAGFADDPGLIANNRLGNGVPGDTETPEQYVPATGFPGKDWETCMTINDTWGFKTSDHNFKSTESLLRNLIDIASKGGNYLLNVGPKSDGEIPAEEVQRLQEMGAWLKKNGASIYATSASPYKRLPFEGRATVKGKELFLNVFEWPAGELTLPGLQTEVRGARCVATGERLTVTKSADGSLTISRPKTLDPLSTAIDLSLSSTPVVVEPEIRVAPEGDGSFRLGAANAEFVGGSIKAEHSGDAQNIGYWTEQSDAPEWKLNVPGDANFAVKLEYACPDDVEGSTFELTVDGQGTGITGTVAKTGSWGDYKTMDLGGTLRLPSGKHRVRIVVKTMPKGAVMNLKHLFLTPSQS